MAAQGNAVAKSYASGQRQELAVLNCCACEAQLAHSRYYWAQTSPMRPEVQRRVWCAVFLKWSELAESSNFEVISRRRVNSRCRGKYTQCCGEDDACQCECECLNHDLFPSSSVGAFQFVVGAFMTIESDLTLIRIMSFQGSLVSNVEITRVPLGN